MVHGAADCDSERINGGSVVEEPGARLEAKERVYAVVVTFNRKSLLLECLEGLFRQTRPIDGLILVDNASEDGTPETLLKNGLISEVPPEGLNQIWETRSFPEPMSGAPLIYLRMPSNEGGAGGFHEGIKKALMERGDWFWMMDDDVEPDETCLAGIMEFCSISKCIHPSKYFEDGTPHEWEGYVSHVTGRRVFQPNISFRKGFSFCTINSGCFEGMMVHRSIVDEIGLPDKRFFLISDDSVYGFLAHFHTPVLYVEKPRIKKKYIYRKEDNSVSDRSIYYGMRNTFLVQQYMNQKIPKYKLVRSFFVFIKFMDYVLNIFQNRKKRVSGYRILIRAVMDGVSGRFGKGI
ncbi:MAG: glycosyltransferase family 2 protein [Leptospirales bacterium]